jgi:2-polyprenyl-3-methyl-5-hydroxy-6-metoxy-1,4-benzoquinol methylase
MYRFISWLSNKRLPYKLALAFLPESTRARVWALSHDMYVETSEQFYGDIYMKHIVRFLRKHLPLVNLRALDLGCGHGRISIRLAKQGFHVVAVEKNQTALRRAVEHAKAEGVVIDFRELDILAETRLGTFDLVLAMEPLSVNGCRSEVEKLIPIVKQNLRQGGIAVFSVHTRYFNVATAIKFRQLVKAKMILDDKDSIRWLQPDDLFSLLNAAGFDSIEIIGIGLVSGMEGEPFSSISNPAEYSNEKSKLLQKIEIEMGLMREVAGCGRYMLALARKAVA